MTGDAAAGCSDSGMARWPRVTCLERQRAQVVAQALEDVLQVEVARELLQIDLPHEARAERHHPVTGNTQRATWAGIAGHSPQLWVIADDLSPPQLIHHGRCGVEDLERVLQIELKVELLPRLPVRSRIAVAPAFLAATPPILFVTADGGVVGPLCGETPTRDPFRMRATQHPSAPASPLLRGPFPHLMQVPASSMSRSSGRRDVISSTSSAGSPDRSGSFSKFWTTTCRRGQGAGYHF